ncbi:hypothetical protein Bca52824_041951 [Brassica carinata]|uniref:Uncharacterized protein n=1 Tax=Brassica carinata TaxID=52824 RepID=A0A8X7RWF7_BRACI|nr:hypothetical protein Bca52824_041951 [Brassica carinata]
MYRVAEPSVVISFTWNSVLSDLEDSRVSFPDDRFHFHSYKEFKAACDLKGDLYGYAAGALALASVSSSVFWTLMFNQPVIMSLGRLDPNLDVANRIDAKVVTKTETVTMGSYSPISSEEAAKAWEAVGSARPPAYGQTHFHSRNIPAKSAGSDLDNAPPASIKRLAAPNGPIPRALTHIRAYPYLITFVRSLIRLA